MCVCVRACVRACACACEHVSVYMYTDLTIGACAHIDVGTRTY